MRITFRLGLLAAVSATGLALPPLAHAQRHDFHGRDYRHFTPHERREWNGGAWRHQWHDGRFAWWWVLGNSWYFYPAPIYPYPTYVPPAVIVQQPPPVPAGLPPAHYWYFCDNPQGYYPYVASCGVPWRAVPATPPN